MAKWFLRAILIVLSSLGMSYIPTRVETFVFTEIYTVIGIMFPLALSQIMTFSFSEIENDSFVKRYRQQLVAIRGVFIVLFALATAVIFLVQSVNYCFIYKFIKFSIRKLYLVYYIFCLVYFIINFIKLANLKDEIEDEIRKFNKGHCKAILSQRAG